ncbi:type IV pilus assembly protein PilM, partial [Candidatus Gottesmanbacteria bacterium]|nr:type IV pilus assembly protein PilM [Candidatus Gottesmanbacteria bacterium]
MSAILGIDIGSHSIKAIELSRSGKDIKLLAAGSVPTPPGALTSSTQADQEALAVSLKKILKDIGATSRDVNIALPESQVFTRVIDVPQLSQRELASAIKWEAEQYIPLPLDQVNLDFTVLRDAKQTGKPTMEALLVAAPKALINKYLTYLELAELHVVGVETEIVAASRALVRTAPSLKTIMIASLGAQTTDLAIVQDGTLAFTRSISSGGAALSRALAQKLEFDISQAEEYKKTYGLETNKLEGKIVEAVKPIMDTIVGEMKRAIAFYLERYPARRIEAILLSGGTAKVPGMVVYMAQEMNIETQLANPWVGIQRESRFSVLDAQGP